MFTPATRAAVVLVLGLSVLLAAPRRSDAAPATPLPGTVGLTQRQVTVRNACVSTYREIKKAKRGDDAALVLALLHPRITGLDFDPDKPAKSKASTKRFQDWMDRLTKLYATARKVQEAHRLNAATTPEAKVEAVARMVILLQQAHLLMQTVEIPVSIRKQPDAVTVFCDQILEVAEPLEAQVKEARGACARFITDGKVGAGWWTPVCADP